MISPLIIRGNAFDIAQQNYAKYSGLNFAEDLVYYLKSGYVYCSPTAFAMFRPIEHEGKRGWFVQMAAGCLGELLRHAPCDLEFVAFCRNNDSNMRVISWEYFIRKVAFRYGWRPTR